MGIDESQFIIRGMSQDLSVSKEPSTVSFENRNLRFNPVENNTFLSIENEKGNKLFQQTTTGIVVGTCVIKQYMLIVSVQNNTTYFYRYNNESEELELIGEKGWNLNMSEDKAIETLGYYENENVIKVYWLDGVNPLRFINIANSSISKITPETSEELFETNRKLSFFENVEVVKQSGGGFFAPGTIQYVLTYSNKNGVESNPFYISSLLYTSNYDRGNSNEESASCSFKITIENPQDNFEYINIYSIVTTESKGTPTTKKVDSLKIEEGTIIYTDNGTRGEIVEPLSLRYTGSGDYIFGTMDQKQNTLFLGDITLNDQYNFNEVKEYINTIKDSKFTSVFFTDSNKEIQNGAQGYYDYTIQLDRKSNQITTFHTHDYYRLGIELLKNNGEYTEPIFIKDAQNNISIDTGLYDSDTPINLISIIMHISGEVINKIKSYGYIGIRPVIVYPEIQDRVVACQGVLNPTIFNIGQRKNGTCYAQASPFFRPMFSETKPTSRQVYYLKGHESEYDASLFYWRNNNYITSSSIITCKNWLEFQHFRQLGRPVSYTTITDDSSYSSDSIPWGSDDPIFGIPEISSTFRFITAGTESNLQFSKWPKKLAEGTTFPYYEESYYIDQSVFTLNSPDLEFEDLMNSINFSNYKMRIIGCIPLTASYSDSELQSKKTYNQQNVNLTIDAAKNIANINRDGWKLKASYNIIKETGSSEEPIDKEYTGISGYSIAFTDKDNQRVNGYHESTEVSRDKSIIANIRYSNKPILFNNSSFWEKELSDFKLFNSNIQSIKILHNTDGNYSYLGNVEQLGTNIGYKLDAQLSLIENKNKKIDSVPIKYMSTPHLVGCFKTDKLSGSTSDSRYGMNVLPSIVINNKAINPATTMGREYQVEWNDSFYSINEDLLFPNNDQITEEFKSGFLWLGEVYQDVDTNIIFGGHSENAYKNNSWKIGGKTYLFNDAFQNNIVYTEGDTYYQRYDCLKTYPSSSEDKNQVIEILSYLCETRINIDGRYDINRGVNNILYANPLNWNKINKAYTNDQNFFEDRITNEEGTDFPSTVTWTKTKIAGADVDAWTNITMVSTLGLDGTLGKISKLINYNDNLIAFQDNGITRINYNERNALSTESGIPVEIGNSGKVEGFQVISNDIGCFNKWTIQKTKTGLYFIDDYNKAIYKYEGNALPTDLSNDKGFKSWMINNLPSTPKIWGPKETGVFKTSVDKITEDVYFIKQNEECLTFNERINLFSSFYSYQNASFINTVQNKTFAINSYNGISKLWEQRAGEYNSFFGNIEPYSIEVIVNDDFSTDKTFNNIEFRADAFDISGLKTNCPFDKLTIKTEYQEGNEDLVWNRPEASSLKKKYRIWYANIPRADGTRDRIRNTWAKLKLKQSNPQTDRMELHDLVVKYFKHSSRLRVAQQRQAE